MRSLPLKSLQTFEAVARHNNYYGAAQELFVTPSAVSHQIKNLEAWLKRPLFKRRGNQLELLPHAKLLANSLSSSIGDIKAACHTAMQTEQSNKLVIAAIPSVATCWLIPRLNDFQQRYPEISLRVTYALHGFEIDFTEVDIAFVFAKSKPIIEENNVELFRSGKSYPVCSADFLRNNGPFCDAKIANLALLHDTAIGDSWQDWCKNLQLPFAGATDGPAFDDFNLLRSAALAGQGIALCPIAMIEDDLKAQRLVQVSQSSVSTTGGYYLVSRSDQSDLNVSSQQFRDWVFNFQTATPS
ncbi:MAG: LysR substrate-binding domain-containing protein [Oceanospirillaceae bacterium]